MSSREHVHPVFLNVSLYIGITKIQAELEIGKSSAILLMITEGLYHKGAISQKTYLQLKKRYERKLDEKIETVPLKGDTPVQPDKEAEDLHRAEVQFREVLRQWHSHDAVWRSKWILRAKKYSERSNVARLLVDLEDAEKITPRDGKHANLPCSLKLKEPCIQT